MDRYRAGTFLLTVLLCYFELVASWDCHYHSFPVPRQLWTTGIGRISSSGSRQQLFYHTLRFATPNSGIPSANSGDDIVDLQHHVRFMRLALEQAERAKRKGEVPIGAIVVQMRHRDRKNGPKDHDDDGVSYEILSMAHNLVETRQDASAHAELLALRLAGERVENWRLVNTTLYSTLEPCPMCLAAAQAFRVSSIVYGANDLRLGAIHTHMRLLDDYQHPFHTIDTVIPGVMKDECAFLLKSFFQERRLGTAKSVSPLPSTSDRSERGKRWRKLKEVLGLLKGIFRRQTR